MGDRHPEAHLGSTPVKLLAGFAREDRRDFLETGRVLEYGLDERIAEEGERDLHLYVVLSGSVSTWRRGVKVATLSAGEVLNETKIFLPRPNQVTAVAAEDAVVLRLPRSEVLAYFRDRPERLLKVFVLNIVAILAQKLETSESQLIAGCLPAVRAAEES